MGKTAALFPGQGAQIVGMGKDVSQVGTESRAVFDQANAILGYDLAGICFEGPADRLEVTDIQQPAIFATSVALWRALQSGPGAIEIDAAAGLSLGEYTALHVAGSLAFEDALVLVQHRGRLMQEAADARPGGMVSMLGLDPEKAEALCEEVSPSGLLRAANFNCPGQIVLSGELSACDRAVELADKYECRATPLKVAGAFHSPLMETAAEELKAHLDETEILEPKFPVLSNVTAEEHQPDQIRRRLFEQVSNPVLWQACMERLLGNGFDSFYEIGPGRVLTGLMRRINRGQKVVNISSAPSLEEVHAA
jgi:[acyl-carrier-protein] S-malonyltransferase